MASVRHFGSLWMTLNEELRGQISACLQRTYICITSIYTTHRMISLSVYENWAKNVKIGKNGTFKRPPVTLKLKVKVTKE